MKKSLCLLHLDLIFLYGNQARPKRKRGINRSGKSLLSERGGNEYFEINKSLKLIEQPETELNECLDAMIERHDQGTSNFIEDELLKKHGRIK